MRRSVLRAAAITLGAGAFVALPSTAWGLGEFIRVTPSTIQAGFQVAIEANCDDAVNPATATSDAFGVVTLEPQRNPSTGVVHLHGTATIPRNTTAGAYKVTLKCTSGQTATTTEHVVNATPANSQGPHTGGGGLARNDNSGLMIGAGAAAAVGGAVLFALARRRRAST